MCLVDLIQVEEATWSYTREVMVLAVVVGDELGENLNLNFNLNDKYLFNKIINNHRIKPII